VQGYQLRLALVNTMIKRAEHEQACTAFALHLDFTRKNGGMDGEGRDSKARAKGRGLAHQACRNAPQNGNSKLG